jgi:hypothetical protein
MQPRGLNVGIDNSNAFALLDNTTGEIGDKVGFACPTSIGVNGNNCRHENIDPFLLLAR